MAVFSFEGGYVIVPRFGPHSPSTFQDVGNWWVNTFSGGWTDPTAWESPNATYDPLDGIFNAGVPGPNDDVGIGAPPDGSEQAQMAAPVDGGPNEPPSSGYVSYDTYPVGDITSGGFHVSGASGTIANLAVSGDGTIALAGLTVTQATTILTLGGVDVFKFYADGSDPTTFGGAYADGYSSETIEIDGGSLTTASLLIGVSTSLAVDPNNHAGGGPDPVADAGVLIVNGATLTGDITRISPDYNISKQNYLPLPQTSPVQNEQVQLNGGAINAKTQLDISGYDATYYTNITGTGGLVATGASITAGAVVIATGDAGEGSASETTGLLSLKSASRLVVTAGNGGDGSLIVGDSGQGTLMATGVSSISDQQALIGSQTGSTGTVVLDGGSWVNTGYIAVGNSGTGMLMVKNGASLSNSGQYGNGYISGLQGSDGSVATITGKGSTWKLDQALIVGNGASGALTIDQGGAVTVSNVLEVGITAGAVGTIAITNGSTLIANSQGGAETSGVLIGDAANAGGDVTIDGAGSTLESMAAASIGYSGDGDLTLSNGGSFKEDAAIIRVGRNAGSLSTLTITDSGSNLIGQMATLYVGYGGAANVLVQSGGTIDVAAVSLGGETGGDGTLDVDGSAAMATMGTITVGDAGNGELDLTNGASITAAALIIGNQDGGAGNVIVIGSSTLDITGTVDVGKAAGSDGTLTVSDADGAITYHEDQIIGDAGQGQLNLNQGVAATAEETMEVGKQTGGYGYVSISDGASLTINGTLDVGVEMGSSGLIIVDGQHSSLSGNDDVTIGDDGEGEITVTNSASVDVTGTLTEGAQEHGSGIDYIANKNTSFHAHGDWIMALAGDHEMDVADQAQVQVDGAFTMGQEEGATGDLTVEGQDTMFTTGDDVKIGDGGTGTVEVDPGATFDATLSDVTLGDQQTGSGEVTLNGDTSTGGATSGQSGEFDAKTLTVGSSGGGQFTANDGSSVTVLSDMTIAEMESSLGEVDITGMGSALSVGGDLTVGGAGTGFLVASGMGSSISIDGMTTVGETGSGTMSVQGGEIDATGSLVIGGKGNGISFVQLGGSLQASGGITLGESDGGLGELDVAGANSTVSVTGDFVVGSLGQGMLNITQTGSVQVNGTVTLGDKMVGVAQVASLDTGGQLFITGDLAIGGSGIGGVDVFGGSDLTVAGAAVIGDQFGAGGTLTVDGATQASGPSIFTFGTLTVGNNGAGHLTISGGALAGGPALATTTTVMIGTSMTGVGDVTVTGKGSDFDVGTIDVGGSGNGDGSLIIEDGAVVRAVDVDVGANGLLSISGNATLNADPLTLDPGAQVSASGTITGDVLGTGAIGIDAMGSLVLDGSVASGITVDFGTAGPDSLTLSQPSVFEGLLANFANGDSIDLDTFGNLSSSFTNNMLQVVQGDTTIADIRFAGSNADGSIMVTQNGLVEYVACYATGTRIATPDGEVAIDALAIGNLVCTFSGEPKPIKWIGKRAYSARFARRNPDLWPVLIKAGAIAEGLPARDLKVSPLHAMFINGILVPAGALINGSNITKPEPLGDVAYLHLELDEHNVIIAEGAPSESFVDDDSRQIFHNVHEYAQCYPHATRIKASYCAPRVTQGFAVERIRSGIAERAGLRAQPAAQPLHGVVDLLLPDRIEGWAQNPHLPSVAVSLDIVLDSKTLVQTLANRQRSGLGRCGFAVSLPHHLSLDECNRLEVRRSSDGALLRFGSPQLRTVL